MLAICWRKRLAKLLAPGKSAFLQSEWLHFMQEYKGSIDSAYRSPVGSCPLRAKRPFGKHPLGKVAKAACKGQSAADKCRNTSFNRSGPFRSDSMVLKIALKAHAP